MLCLGQYISCSTGQESEPTSLWVGQILKENTGVNISYCYKGSKKPTLIKYKGGLFHNILNIFLFTFYSFLLYSK